MAKEGIIFADMDGTLVFHGEIHGIQEKNKADDGLVRVLDPSNNKDYLAHDVSTNLYKVFLNVDTKRLAHQLRDKYHFVFVSGARKTTMDRRKDIMDFADAYILENGGIILGGDYSPDSEWSERLDPEKPYLDVVRQQLQGQGWVLDIKGRTTALRVRKKDNPERQDGEFENLCEDIELPAQLRKTMNIGSLDIILASAGKGNGVDYLTGRFGYTQPQSIGIGDDVNDIDMLTHTGRKYVLGNAYPEALDIARKEGWYVSKGLHFDGINEILRVIDSTKTTK